MLIPLAIEGAHTQKIAVIHALNIFMNTEDMVAYFHLIYFRPMYCNVNIILRKCQTRLGWLLGLDLQTPLS